MSGCLCKCVCASANDGNEERVVLVLTVLARVALLGHQQIGHRGWSAFLH